MGQIEIIAAGVSRPFTFFPIFFEYFLVNKSPPESE